MRPHSSNLGALSTGMLVTAAVVAAALVPRADWSRVTEPTTQAVYGFFLLLAVPALARATGHVCAERAALALFLGAMPIVYLRAALLHPGSRVWPEVVGAVLFAGAAARGYAHPTLLVAGIAAHGVGWDLAHRLVPSYHEFSRSGAQRRMEVSPWQRTTN